MNPIDHSEDFDLFALFKILKNKARALLIMTMAVALVSIIISLMLPNIYKSTAIFIPPSQGGEKGSLGALMGQLSSTPFAGIMGAGGPVESIDTFEVLKTIVLNRENMGKVIQKFDLKQVYMINSDKISDVEALYRERISLSKNKKTGIATLSFEDESPIRSAEIVNFVLSQMEEISRTQTILESKRKLRFLENRLLEAKKELNTVEETLNLFQKSNNILSADLQARASIEAATKIQTEMQLNQIRLNVKTLMGVNSTHPEAKLLQLEIEIMQKQLSSIESGNPSVSGTSVTYIPLRSIPRIQVEMERLLRSKTVAQEIYLVLTRENEITKIEASKDLDVIKILEYGHKPERKERPKRSIIVIFATFFGFILSCALILFQSLKHRAL